MGYIEGNLLKGERVLHRGRVHWWAWAKGVVWIAIGVVFVGSGDFGALLGAMMFLFGLFLIVRGLVTVYTTELAVTNKRVIAKFGFIRRSTIEVLHQKIEGLSVYQSIFGRLLGFGTVVVNGTGSGRTPVPHIAAPLEFRRKALEVLEPDSTEH